MKTSSYFELHLPLTGLPPVVSTLILLQKLARLDQREEALDKSSSEKNEEQTWDLEIEEHCWILEGL
ncbi:hypothetical protein J6590_098907 [Homalodisca vitripennis]|nr:hypothetical protein J6590_098907 [Homalodisca vitripennis]